MGNRSRSGARPLPIENNVVGTLAPPLGLRAHFKTATQPVLCLATIEFVDEDGSKSRDVVPMVCGGPGGLVDATLDDDYLGVSIDGDSKDFERVVAQKTDPEEDSPSGA